ncbi:MAG: helix-turn-helix domain-containing protein [Kiritimatiellia bacterium]|nr:helix-turn-helix domain-containing protein [Lentisphaerota bacterium]
MPGKQRLDEAAVNKIVELYEGGEKAIKDIAKELNVAVATVVSHLKKQGKYKSRKYKKGGKSRETDAVRNNTELNTEAILRDLRTAEAEVARLKKALSRAVVMEEKRFQRLKQMIKS